MLIGCLAVGLLRLGYRCERDQSRNPDQASGWMSQLFPPDSARIYNINKVA